MLLMIGLAAIIVFIIFTTAKLRWHPFLVLIVTAILTALFYRLPLTDIPKIIGDGFGGILGYIGLVMIAVMVAWWIKSRDHIKEESKRRDRIHELTENRENPDADFSKDDEKELKKHIDDSPRDDEQLKEKIEDEVTEQSSNSSSSSSSD